MKRIKSLLLLAALIAAVFAPAGVSAAKKAGLYGNVVMDKQWECLLVGGQNRDTIELFETNDVKGKDIISVKSSNRKVACIDDRSAKYGSTAVYIVAKDAGKATITAKFKYKGKTYTTKHRIIVKKYDDGVITSFKLGNTEYADLLNKSSTGVIEKKIRINKNGIPVKFKLKKNWRISARYYSDLRDDGYTKLKNGGRIKAGKWFTIEFEIWHTKHPKEYAAVYTIEASGK